MIFPVSHFGGRCSERSSIHSLESCIICASCAAHYDTVAPACLYACTLLHSDVLALCVPFILSNSDAGCTLQLIAPCLMGDIHDQLLFRRASISPKHTSFFNEMGGKITFCGRKLSISGNVSLTKGITRNGLRKIIRQHLNIPHGVSARVV